MHKSMLKSSRSSTWSKMKGLFFFRNSADICKLRIDFDSMTIATQTAFTTNTDSAIAQNNAFAVKWPIMPILVRQYGASAQSCVLRIVIKWPIIILFYNSSKKKLTLMSLMSLAIQNINDFVEKNTNPINVGVNIHINITLHFSKHAARMYCIYSKMYQNGIII